MSTNFTFCPNCSAQNSAFETMCRQCGAILPQRAMPQQMGNQQLQNLPGADKKMAAGICGILLGAFGVHKFIMGYTNEGIIMLVVSLVGGFLLCGIPTMVVSIIGLVEGIMYLTKSDEEFSQTYFLNKKSWF